MGGGGGSGVYKIFRVVGNQGERDLGLNVVEGGEALWLLLLNLNTSEHLNQSLSLSLLYLVRPLFKIIIRIRFGVEL